MESHFSRAGAVLAGTASVLVGSSFVFSSLLTGYPFLGGQALRYVLAAVVLMFVARPWETSRPRPTPRDMGWLALLGATGLLGFNLAVLAASRTAEPAVVGVMVGCVPLVMALVTPLLARRRISPWLLVCAALVVVGAAVVQGFGRTDLAGSVYSLLALAGEVAFSLAAMPVLPKLGPVLVSTYACAFAGVEAAVLAVVVDGGAALRMPTAKEAVALGWLVVAVTVVAFLCWYEGLRRLQPERATLLAGLIPVSAAVLAPLAGTGYFGAAQLLGSLLVAVGVGLGLRRPRFSDRRNRETGTDGRGARGVPDGTPVDAATGSPPGRYASDQGDRE
ncbi:DMT family transporter [Streptomyces sp. NPDC014733]|uniref:DMT family transporter n=1 Tax=Streptomyces sp. NPDC014733 TaxID=3364885 RepID=UPI0036F4D52B